MSNTIKDNGNLAEQWKQIKLDELKKLKFTYIDDNNKRLYNSVKIVLMHAIILLYGNAKAEQSKYQKIVELIWCKISSVISQFEYKEETIYQTITKTIQNFFEQQINQSENNKEQDNQSKQNLSELTEQLTNNLENILDIEDKDNLNEKETNTNTNNKDKTKKEKKLSITFAQNIYKINQTVVCFQKMYFLNVITYFIKYLLKDSLRIYSNTNILQNALQNKELQKLLSKKFINTYKLSSFLFIYTYIHIKILKNEINYHHFIITKWVTYSIYGILHKNKYIYELAKKSLKYQTLFNKILNLIKKNDTIKKKFNFSDVFKKIFNPILEPFKKDKIVSTILAILASFGLVINEIKKRNAETFEKVKDYLKAAKIIIQYIAKKLYKLFRFTITKIWQGIRFALYYAWKTSKEFVVRLYHGIRFISNRVSNFFKNTRLGQGISNRCSRLRIFISSKLNFIRHAISRSKFITRFRTVGKAIAAPFKFCFSICQKSSRFFRLRIINPIRNFPRNVIKYVSKSFRYIGRAISGAIRNVVKYITRAISKAIAKVFRKRAQKKIGQSIARKIIIKIIEFVTKKLIKAGVVKAAASLALSFVTAGVSLIIWIALTAWDLYSLYTFLKPMLNDLMTYYTFAEIKNLLVDFVKYCMKDMLKELIDDMLKAGKEWFNKYVIGAIKWYTQSLSLLCNILVGNFPRLTFKYKKQIKDKLTAGNLTFNKLTSLEKLNKLDKFNYNEVNLIISNINYISDLIAKENDSFFPSTKKINKLIDERQLIFLQLAKYVGQFGITELNSDTIKNLLNDIKDIRTYYWLSIYGEDVIRLHSSLKNKQIELQDLKVELTKLQEEFDSKNNFFEQTEEFMHFLTRKYTEFKFKKHYYLKPFLQ